MRFDENHRQYQFLVDIIFYSGYNHSMKWLTKDEVTEEGFYLVASVGDNVDTVVQPSVFEITRNVDGDDKDRLLISDGSHGDYLSLWSDNSRFVLIVCPSK